MRRMRSLTLGPAAALAFLPSVLAAQDSASRDAYFRAVGDHFRIPVDEVRVLGEWDLSTDEIPVVLFFARHGGVSADALVALKRGGRSWADLADRYGLDAGVFHVPLDGSASAGSLASVYERFRALPSARWGEITLRDADIVRLVNVRVISEVLRVSPASAVEAFDRTGSFVAAYRSLVGT